MSVAKRNRIVEIIVGILIIVYTLSILYKLFQFYSQKFDLSHLGDMKLKELVVYDRYFLNYLFYMLIGVMLIFRIYRGLPIKIAYCITGLIAFLCSNGLIIIYRHFTSYDGVYTIGRMPTYLMIKYIGGSIILGVAIFIGFMAMNRNNIWKSRKHILIYTYIALGLLAVINAFNLLTACVIFLPLLMQDSTVNKSKKAIAGETALVILFLPKWVAEHIVKLLLHGGSEFRKLLTGVRRVSKYSDDSYLYIYVTILLLALAFLAPLMVFERAFNGTEKQPVVIDNADKAENTETKEDGDDNN